MDQAQAQAMEEERRRQEEEAQRAAEEAQRQAEEAAKKAADQAAQQAAKQIAASQTQQANDRQARIEENRRAAEEAQRKAVADKYKNADPTTIPVADRGDYWSNKIHEQINPSESRTIPALERPQQITGPKEDLKLQYANRNGVSLEEAERAYEAGKGNAAFAAPSNFTPLDENGEERSRGAGNAADLETKMNRWLSTDYKMTREDRKEAQGIVRDFNRQYGSQGQLADPDQAERIAALDNKSRAFGSFNAGFMRPIMNATNAVQKGADWLLGGSAELGAGMIDDLAGTNLAGAVQNARNQINDAQDQNSAFLRNTYQNAQAQNNLAYQGGNLAGNAALYAATNPAFDSLGAAAGLGKVGGAVLNQVGQNAQDLALDTIPNYIANKEAGMSDEEAAREARNSVLMNAAGNAIVGGALPILGRGIDAIRGMRNSAGQAVESIAQDADNIARQIDPADLARQNAEGVDNILAQRQQAAENLEGLSERIPTLQQSSKGIGAKTADQIDKERQNVVDQIEQIATGEMPSNEYIRFGDTPEYMEPYGNVNNQLAMSQNTAFKVAYPEGYQGGKHNLGFQAIAELPEQLNNPVAVLKSNTQPRSGIPLTSMIDANGNPVIAPIHMDKQSDIGTINEIASMLGRRDLEELLNRSETSYIDEEKIRRLLSGEGLQLPELKADTDPFLNRTVSRNSGNVNPESDIPILNNADQGTKMKSNSPAIREALSLEPTEEEIRRLEQFPPDRNGEMRRSLMSDPNKELTDSSMDKVMGDVLDAFDRYKITDPKLKEMKLEMMDLTKQYDDAYRAGDQAGASEAARLLGNLRKRFDRAASKEGAGIEGYDGFFNSSRFGNDINAPAKYMNGGKTLAETDPFADDIAAAEIDGRDTKALQEAREFFNNFMSDASARFDMSKPGAEEALEKLYDTTYNLAGRGDNATRKAWAEANVEAEPFLNEPIPEETIKKGLALDLQLFAKDLDDVGPNPSGQNLKEVDSLVATNTLRNSGIFTEQEYNDLIEPISKYTPQSERETMDLAKRRLLQDHDEVLDRYTREKPNVKSFDAVDVDTMMLSLYEQRQILQNATDEATKQEARDTIRKLGLTLRKTGTENGRAIQAFAKWTRTADGAVAAADATAAGQVEDFLTKNPKLAKEIDDVAGEISDRVKGLFKGQPTPESRQQVIDLINEVLDNHGKVSKRINDDGVNRIADSIMKGNSYDDIQNQLEFLSTGFSDVDDATIDRVNQLFDEMQGLDFNSKEYVQKETEAFSLLANDISHGGSFKDKFDQWRYFSMLANPTTHIRNLVGNATFRGINGAKDTLAAAIEKSADTISKIAGKGGIERTKSILTPADKSLVDACRTDGMQHAYRELTGNKYTGAARGIEGQMPAWNPKKAGGRVMNKLTGANTAALNKEDELFVVNKFQNAMAGYLKANGADASIFTKDDSASKELVEQARNYAIGQAKIAAFHQEGAFGSTASAFASGVNNFRNSDNAVKKALGLAADITIPFKKTPANILESALAYSPLELAKTFTTDTYKLVKGTMKPAQYIDNLSKGLTGTAGLAFGAILAREGILSVDTRQTDREAAFDKQTGRQNLSIKLGGKSIGLDQLIPAAAPLIYGATVYDAMNGGDDNAMDAIVTGATALANGVTDMTMLSGIADALSSVRYADSNAGIWGAVSENLASNLASQMLPTLGRKIETTVDDTRRSTYTDKQGSISKFVDQEGKYLSTKIPGLQKAGEKMQQSDNETIRAIGDRFALEPDIDAKGQERKNIGVNAAQRAANNFLNPLNVTNDTSTPLDDERRRLAKDTNNDKLIPYISSSESKIGDKKLTPKEWTDYRKERGQSREEMSEAFFGSKGYNDLSDADKADVYTTIDSLSKNMAQEGYGKELSSKDQRYKDIYDKSGAEAVVKSIRDDFVLSDIAHEAGGEDARVTDKLREIYDVKGEKAAKEYAQAYNAAGKDGNAPSIQDVLDYATKNPKTSKATLNALMPKNATGSLTKENGQWVYKDKEGKTTKTGMTEAEHKAEEKVSQDLSSYGLDKKSAAATYAKAQQTIPSLTTKQFADTYKQIDSNSNQGITQKELVSYMNNSKLSKDEGEQIWSAYGSDSWKKSATYNNGQWSLSGGSSGKSGKSSGGTSSSAAYQKAVQAFGEGYTTSDYKNTKSAIDTDGNGKLKKAEVKAYMDAHPEQADQIWAAYSQKNWKR